MWDCLSSITWDSGEENSCSGEHSIADKVVDQCAGSAMMGLEWVKPDGFEYIDKHVSTNHWTCRPNHDELRRDSSFALDGDELHSLSKALNTRDQESAQHCQSVVRWFWNSFGSHIQPQGPNAPKWALGLYVGNEALHGMCWAWHTGTVPGWMLQGGDFSDAWRHLEL